MQAEENQKFLEDVAHRQRLLFGQRYVGSSISKICSPDWVQVKMMDYMKNPNSFLLYCGSPGIGKTFFCAALTEWAMKNFGNNWRYWSENNLLKHLRDSMDHMKGDYLDVLKYSIDHDLLILDDVGSSVKGTEWREEILFAILDARYNSLKPTIITSNFCSKEFREKYSARIHSRLFSHDNTIIEIPNGVDFRLQKMSNVNYKLEKFNIDN